MAEMPEPVGLDEALRHLEIRERLVKVYATGMRHAHDGGRVEVHLGSDIIEHLRTLAREAMGDRPNFALSETVWGFPIVETTASPDHMSVHVVHFIA